MPQDLALCHLGTVAVDELFEPAAEFLVDNIGEVGRICAYKPTHLFHRHLFVGVAAVSLQTQQDTRMYSFFICAHGRLIFSFRGQRYTFFSLLQQLCRIYFAIKLDFLCFWTFKVSLTLLLRFYEPSDVILWLFDNAAAPAKKGKKHQQKIL